MLHPNSSGALHDILEDYAKFHLGFCEMQMKLETAFNLADQIELSAFSFRETFCSADAIPLAGRFLISIDLN